MNPPFSRIWWANILLFSFTIIFPSVTIFKKLPSPLLAIYCIIAPVSLFLLFAWILPAAARFLSAKIGLTILLVFSVALALAHIFIHPLLDTDGFSIGGIRFGATDSDDAIDISLDALFSGRFPYDQKTFLNAPITPMPGALLLAAPFYLFGITALQGVFWFALFWVLVWKMTSDIRITASLISSMIVLSPNVIYHLITGTDYLTNGIYVLVAMVCMMKGIGQKPPVMGVFSVFVGITLASRPHWLLLLPIMFFYAAHRASYRLALLMILIILFSMCLLVLPFYVVDPSNFSPLHVGQFLTIGHTFPHADIITILCAGFLSIFLGFRYRGASLETQLKSAFIVLALVILAGFSLASVAGGAIDLYYSHFGMFFITFGTLATGLPLAREAFARGSEMRTISAT